MPDTAPPSGYLAVPPGGGPFPGVVVVHDVFGLTPDLRRQADRLASGGYLAYVPDLWHGKAWIRCTRNAFRQMTTAQGPIFDELDASAAMLAARADCTGRTGIIGFCMGGAFALLSAPRAPFSAASVNYGPIADNIGELLAGACPVVASYGSKDAQLMKALPRLEQALADNHVASDVKVYEGATHAFMNEHGGGTPRIVMKLTGMRFDPDASADSWRRIFAFFGDHLAGSPAS